MNLEVARIPLKKRQYSQRGIKIENNPLNSSLKCQSYVLIRASRNKIQSFRGKKTEPILVFSYFEVTDWLRPPKNECLAFISSRGKKTETEKEFRASFRWKKVRVSEDSLIGA